MTQHEHFKRRVRERMAKTGERYAAARRVLVEQMPTNRRRRWVSEPEFTDEVITRQTGRTWDDWCEVIDRWVDETADDDSDRRNHTAIAAYVHGVHGIDHWWAQGVTVGYERIVGLRLPHQMKDGTFTANKSMTVSIDPDEMRALLLDEADRSDLFGGASVELKSRPASKSIRLALDPGSVLISIEPATKGRSKVTVAHERLPNFEDVAQWKFYWTDWLNALDQS